MSHDPSTKWRVTPGTHPAVASIDAGSTPGAPGDRGATEVATAPLHARLLELQDRLWAERQRSLLIVLQGLDASGKDRTISHVFRGLNPLGTTVSAFTVPTDAERAHDFLWRVHAHCPARGEIAIFNRSHYEDVLAARVHDLVPEQVWRSRYEHIVAFEALLAHGGTTVVKILLHISLHEQLERLEARLADPAKRWKLHPQDFAERGWWEGHQQAFDEMLARTSTEAAPWHVVPADHNWYRNWAVSTILIETLEAMHPRYPVLPTI